MLFVAIQPASAYDNYKEFFFKATATAQPTGAGKVYVSASTTEPDADKYAETSEDTGIAEKGYDDGDPVPESAYGERELWAKPNPGFQFAGWSTAADPATIISTEKHYTADDFVVTSTDKANPTVVSYIANFKEAGAVEDGKYYIKNVESGKFISQGQWWGTHATLDGDGLVFDVIYNAGDKTYTLQNALGYFGNDEYIDAPEARIGKWAITLKDGIFTMTEGGRNLCVNGVNVYLNADDAAANWEFVPVADRQVTNGTFAKPAEMTYMIKHPNFEANKGAWVVEGATNMGQLDTSRGGDFTAESWNSASFSVKQTIEGLKPGIYRLTFNGYYRYNAKSGDEFNNNESAIAAHADGTEVINAYVQLNATEQPLLSVADEASVELAGGVAPNNIGEAQDAFAKGAYINEVIATVAEDGKLEIAFKKDQQAGTDWAIFDNLQLEYLGGFPAIKGGNTYAYASEVNAHEVYATFNIAGTGIEILDESLIQVKKGTPDGDGWWTYDTDVEGATLTSALEPLGDGTTNINVTFASENITYGEQYRIFIQKEALSCYGLTNSSSATNTIITPNKPAEFLSELEIVGEIQGTLNFIEGQSYEGVTDTIKGTNIASLLGCDEKAINASVVVSPLVAETEAAYEFSDKLQGIIAATDGWFGRYTYDDEDSGKEVTLTPNGLHAWGAGCTTYIHAPELKDGNFSVTYGQFPGTLKPGDTDNIVLYVLNGNKAVKVTYTINVEEKPVIPFADKTMVACDTININASYDSGYAGPSFSIDVEKVAAALGCSVNSLDPTFFASEESLSSESTAGNGGCWLDENGHVISWGDQASFFLEPTTNGDYAEWHSGQMPGKFETISENVLLQGEFVFIYGDNYYKIHANYTIKPAGEIGELEMVAEEAISKQIIPDADNYPVDGDIALDVEYISGLIGTSDFVMYTDGWDAEAEAVKMVKNSTCDPAPGFWLGGTEHNGFVTNDGWGQNNACGVCFVGGNALTFFQLPGARSVGDTYQAHLYFMNEENGKYVQYTLTVKYVEDITPEAEIVGKESIEMPINEETLESEGVYDFDIDMTNAMAKLEITAEELEISTPVVAKSKSTNTEVSFEEDIYLNADGFYTEVEEDIAYRIVLNLEGSTVKIEFEDMNEHFASEEKTPVMVTFGIEYDNKTYLFNITMADPATGISAAPAADADAVIYNIAGQKLAAPVKGINIINGVKVIK